MSSKRGWRLVTGAGLCSLALAAAAPHAGAVTIGQFATTNPPTASCNGASDRDIVQPTVTSGTSFVVPPFGATIISWSHLAANGAGQQLTFKVFRLAAAPQTYRLIGADGPRPLNAGVENKFPVNIPVLPGDVIGLNQSSPANTACSEVLGGEPYLFRTPGLAVGQAEMFGNTVNSRLNVKAEVLPSDKIELGTPKLNKKKGTASLVVTVPGPGELALTGNKVKTAAASGASKSAAVTSPGDITLTIKPRGKTKKKLAEKGKATISYDVSYTPTGGTLRVRNEKVKLKKRL